MIYSLTLGVTPYHIPNVVNYYKTIVESACYFLQQWATKLVHMLNQEMGQTRRMKGLCLSPFQPRHHYGSCLSGSSLILVCKNLASD